MRFTFKKNLPDSIAIGVFRRCAKPKAKPQPNTGPNTQIYCWPIHNNTVFIVDSRNMIQFHGSRHKNTYLDSLLDRWFPSTLLRSHPMAMAMPIASTGLGFGPVPCWVFIDILNAP